jgi:hypothetical protein
MELLIRPAIEQGECLSSYLQRVSNSNFISSHYLWRHVLKSNTHYPQSSISRLVDVTPSSTLDLSLLSSLLLTSQNTLEDITFMNVFKKFGVDIDDINHSRILGNLIDTNRKFCPECISENPYFKLIWQVTEIKHCERHGLELNTKCSNCNSFIPILPNSADIRECPSCGFDLCKNLRMQYVSSGNEQRIYADWHYMLNQKTSPLHSIGNINNEQNIALRILFFTEPYKNVLTMDEKTTMSSIMQLARCTKSSLTFIHLGSILHFLRKCNVPIQEFFSMNLPQEYIVSILRPKVRLIDNLTCQAPWCKQYLKNGSLKRTPSSLRIHKSGDTLKYYMYCKSCATEYALDTNGLLCERSFFIQFAWNKVRPLLSSCCTLKELTLKLNSSQDKVTRSIIFLAANHIIAQDDLPVNIPSTNNEVIMSRIKDNVIKGIPAKKIRSELGLKYNDFLYYWLSIECQLLQFNKKVRRPDKASSKEERERMFTSVVEELIDSRIPITINSICEELDICPESLRQWGLLPKVKEYKNLQTDLFKENYRDEILNKANEVLYKTHLSNNQISSEELYKSIGVSRTVLVRNFPDLTKYIHERLLEYKP